VHYSLGELTPKIDASAYIADSAQVIGNVHLAANSSVWFQAVLRGDNDLISVGAGSNVQDGSVLHVDPGCPINIGEDVTIGHKVCLHGCTIGRGSLIGINAVVLNNANIGEFCVIGANSLVTEDMEIPDGSLVLGSPAKIVQTLDQQTRSKLLQGAAHYVDKAKLYRTQLVQQ